MAARFSFIAATCGVLALTVPAAAQSGDSLALGTSLTANLDTGQGEGNFTALFESMERDQLRRGVLKVGEDA